MITGDKWKNLKVGQVIYGRKRKGFRAGGSNAPVMSFRVEKVGRRYVTLCDSTKENPKGWNSIQWDLKMGRRKDCIEYSFDDHDFAFTHSALMNQTHAFKVMRKVEDYITGAGRQAGYDEALIWLEALDAVEEMKANKKAEYMKSFQK